MRLPGHRSACPPWLLLLAVLLPCLLTACQERVDRAEARARRLNPKEIRHDAAVVYKDNLVSTPGYAIVARVDWPKSIQAFDPVDVHVYRDGVALVLTASTQPESGIYIVPEGLNLVPRSDSRTHYRRVNDGIYLYEFGSKLR